MKQYDIGASQFKRKHQAGWGSIAPWRTGRSDFRLLAPVVGAIIGAFLYRKLIGRHLPCECGIDE
jgi:glycerol uptake facilitator protein